MTTEADLHLADGRLLHVYDTGPADSAVTVFWHHGTPNTGAPPEPLLFHCVAGKDRTGLIAALLLALADATPDAIARDYRVSGENLQEAYLRRYADSGRDRVLEAVRCPEQGAYNMLVFLERAGGVRSYLAQIGLSSQEIAQLRARLRG